MNLADVIGKRGESIAFGALLQGAGGPAPLFNPVLLGEKNATFDFLVQLAGLTDLDAYFFAQVKATRRGVRSRSRTLPVTLPREDVATALRCPVPSYLLSVDDRTRLVYVTAVNRRLRQGVSAVPTTHPLNSANASRLWDEVQSYWRGVRRPRVRSHFSI